MQGGGLPFADAAVEEPLVYTSNNLDPCTILVHLPVAHDVEPGPGEENRAGRWGGAGDGESVAVGQRAATDDGFDDLEGHTVVIGER